jgi:hypothetical protein
MDDITTSVGNEGIIAMLLGFGISFVVFVVLFVFYSYCLGRVLQKANKPLWAGFVPVYNTILMLEIVGRPWWWSLVLIGCVSIPLVNFVGIPVAIVLYILFSIELAKSFGKDTVYGVLLAVFGFVMLPILAFSDTAYVGPAAVKGGATPTV